MESGGEGIGEWRRGRKRLLETDVAREEESTEREKESTVECRGGGEGEWRKGRKGTRKVENREEESIGRLGHPFFSKECFILCILFRSFKKNVLFSAFFSVLFKRTERFLRSFPFV